MSTGGDGAAWEPKAEAAWRSPVAWLVLLGTFALGISADLWSKSEAFARVALEPVVLESGQLTADPDWQLPWHPGIRVLGPDLLDFHLVLNHGAVFGIGQHRRGAFIVLTLVAISAGLLVFARWTTRRAHLAHVAIGLILAGGVGNLYDRVVFGAVRDFLHMLPRRELPFGLHWPGGSAEVFPWVFNIADVLLLTGMSMLLIQAALADRAERRRARLAVEPEAEATAAP